jgi:hypothetical protein
MPRTVVRTAFAEASLTQIVTRVSDYRKLISLDFQTDPRRRPRLQRPTDLRSANAIVDLMAIAESFTSARLLDLRQHVTPDNVSTWKKRETAWSNHGGVNLSNSPNWHALLGFVEVRNGLQHGLGKLTDRQLGNYRNETLKYISAANVYLNGGQIILVKENVANCEHICTDFVKWLDFEAPFS